MMRHDFIDRFSRGSSPIHRLPAGLKAGAAVAMLSVSIAFPDWWVLAPLGGFLLVVLMISRIPAGFVARRILLFEPVIAVLAATNLLRPEGLGVFLGILARGTFAIGTMVLLSNTTPFSALLELLRWLRFPPILVTVLALLYRYLFILIDEAERILRARRARTVVRKGRWRILGTVLGELFVRSTERSERVYLAMRARGWR
jgi:cobalt/nickel transport system permease protein